MSTHMIGPNHGHKIPVLWLKIILIPSKGILWPWFGPIKWVLILKLSKSLYNESGLLFHVHKSYLSTSKYVTYLKTRQLIFTILSLKNRSLQCGRWSQMSSSCFIFYLDFRPAFQAQFPLYVLVKLLEGVNMTFSTL